jgi:carboxyl-terminal processing protease
MRRPLKLLMTTCLIAAASFPVVSWAQKNNTFELLNLFGDVFERVRTDYVEEVKDADIIEAAINGMLTSLDPHSGYMNEKAFKEMQVQTRGEFGGLGIEVTMDNGLVKVVSPIDDTPAAKAGLMPGDYISYINDEAVMGLTLAEAVEKMRGPVDSKVKLTILRETKDEPLEVMLTRAVIKIRSAKARAEGEDIVYLRITSFTEQTTDLMRDEFKRAQKEVKQLRGVVLDLRNNPGGLLEQAVSISDAFLKQGEVVSTRERDPNKTRRYPAHSGDELIDENVPIVVIVNNGSASAAEIVSGALQDHKRAIILGTKTFGKGSVQTVIPLPEHGAMRLTTARYYTPSGHSIQAKGIEPDIIVEPAKIEPLKSDKFRMEADLRKRLENLEDKKERSKKADEKPQAPENGKDKEKDKDVKKNGLQEDAAAQDFQLQRAIDLLRAVNVYNKTGTDK